MIVTRSNWTELSFGDIFEISSSKRVLEREWKQDGVPFYRAREIVKLSRDGVVNNELFISEDLYQHVAKRFGAPEPGDLMVSAVGTLGACYQVRPNDRFYFKDASVLRFHPKIQVCSRFFEYAFLHSALKSQVESGSGSTVGTLTISRANALRINLPPLDEQRRIAAILDKVDALRRSRRAQTELLNGLVGSVFLEVFGSAATNPKKWPVRPLGTLVNNEDSRRVPVKLADREVRAGKYPYYGASGIIDHVNDFLFDGRRLLVAEDGANLLSRSTPVAFFAEGKFWVNNHAHVLAEGTECNLTFLRSFIEQIDLTPFVTGSAQPKLNRANMDKIPVMCPPSDLQTKFQVEVHKLEELAIRSRQSERGIERLFSSLQHRAFSGQL